MEDAPSPEKESGTPVSGRNGRVTREGPFWDVMAGRVAPPPSAALLGWELVSVDPEAGTIEVAFTATERSQSLRSRISR